MKNRLFPIIISLCFVTLVGLAFLQLPRPQTEAPIETESVQESVKPTDMSRTEDATPSEKTDATPQASLPSIDGIDMDAYKAALRSKDPERIKEVLGPELSARVDAGMQFMEEKMEGLEEGEFPDLNLQEYMNIFMGEDGPKINFAEIAQNGFRRHFPEGEPEDYAAEMAERIHEIVADTPGDFQKVMMAVTMDLAREQDFQFWALANFKGEIGQQMKWMTEQILVAGELENIQYTVPEDMSTLQPTLTGSETQDTVTLTSKLQATTSATASTESPSTRSNEKSTVATENSQTELPSSMSVKRINSIRELLSQNGTDAGLLKLLETDKEAANYL
ncbi:hypothetical protein J5I95_11620, partial [Candidatus Poribacteria bacterium]|nr:hypothetical protein [Candidatus Poribacteria bacterium]